MGPKIFVIDGNIGVGKSTILKELKSRGYAVFEEPMDILQPLLEFCQEDRIKWTYTFQITVMAHFLRLQQLIKTMDVPVVFIERCSISNWVFAVLAYENNIISKIELNSIKNIYTLFNMEFSKIFYLKGSPELCLQRIHERNRKGEEYICTNLLTQLNNTYEKIYTHHSRYILDCAKTTQELIDEIISYV